MQLFRIQFTSFVTFLGQKSTICHFYVSMNAYTHFFKRNILFPFNWWVCSCGVQGVVDRGGGGSFYIYKFSTHLILAHGFSDKINLIGSYMCQFFGFSQFIFVRLTQKLLFHFNMITICFISFANQLISLEVPLKI